MISFVHSVNFSHKKGLIDHMPLPIVESIAVERNRDRLPNLPLDVLSVGKAFIVPATFVHRFAYVRTCCSKYSREHNVRIATVVMPDGSLQCYMPLNTPETFSVIDSIKPVKMPTVTKEPNKDQFQAYLRIMEKGSSFEFKDVTRIDEFTEWSTELGSEYTVDCKLMIHRK